MEIEKHQLTIGIGLAFLGVASSIILPNVLPTLKILLITLLLTTIPNNIKLRYNVVTILCGLSYLIAYIFNYRVEERLSPFMSDPNFEALFFILLFTSCSIKKTQLFASTVFVAMASGSMTALIATGAITIYPSRMLKPLYTVLAALPLIMLLCISSVDSREILLNINQLNIYNIFLDLGLNEYKLISFQNRLESQLNHLDAMSEYGVVGYGKASLVNIELGAHNFFVQYFAQQGILIYIPFVYIYWKAINKLNENALKAILFFSITIDVYSFLPIIIAAIVNKKDESINNMP